MNEWSEKLETIDRKYPDFHNMLELHQIRIKIKRFRYALQTLPEVPRDSNLLRRLKRLQDMLGFYMMILINAKLVQCFSRMLVMCSCAMRQGCLPDGNALKQRRR